MEHCCDLMTPLFTQLLPAGLSSLLAWRLQGVKPPRAQNVMRDDQNNPGYSTWFSTILTVGTLVLIVGILHWAREVLMPIALAILLSFILSPIVSLLRRRGLGQRISVALTVALAFLLIGCIGMLILTEFRGLANELPEYQQNIRKKIADLHVVVKTGSLGKLRRTMQEVMKELKKEDPLETETKNAAPIPVVVKDSGRTLDLALVKSLFSPAVMAGRYNQGH
jgi:hypothetical protein